MTNENLPVMKPVLVKRVSDDIRDLRQSDAAQQSVVFTARAIADIFKCDLIDVADRESKDKKYCETHGVKYGTSTVHSLWMCNLDKVIDGGRRALGTVSNPVAGHEDQIGYFNGPAMVNDVAFLEVFTVLPSGLLSWRNYNGKTPIAGNDDAAKATDKQEYSEHIRQVLYPTGMKLTDKVGGKYNFELETTAGYTRLGRLDPDHRDEGIYIWSDWETLNGEKIHVVIDENTAVVGNATYNSAEDFYPSPNTVYEVHTNIKNFVLPDPKQFKLGTTIALYQYPLAEVAGVAPVPSSTNVSYNETYFDTGLGTQVSNPMYMTCVPAVQRNTGVLADVATHDKLVPSVYEFEVVEGYDSGNKSIGHTWELLVNSDETDYLAGIADLLDEHVENVEKDMLLYGMRKYNGEVAGMSTLPSATSDLIINRVVASAGYIKAVVDVKDQHFASFAPDWSMTVRVANPHSDPIFKILTAAEIAAGPLSGQMYYVANGTTFVLASETGKISKFVSGTDYYTLDASNSMFEDIATFSSGTMKYGPNYAFRYIPRDSIVQIIVHPGTVGHISVRDGQIGGSTNPSPWAVPSVSFYPDPHGSYVLKPQICHGVYTDRMWQDMIDSGELPSGLGESTKDHVMSVAAGIALYKKIVGTLQEKGKFFGLLSTGDTCTNDNYSPNSFTKEGEYWITPKYKYSDSTDAIDTGNTFPLTNRRWFAKSTDNKTFVEITPLTASETIKSACMRKGVVAETWSDLYIGCSMADSLGWPNGATCEDCKLIVTSNKRASANLLREEEADGTTGNFLREATVITQTLTQLGSITQIWIRSGDIQENGSVVWGPWGKFNVGTFGANLTDKSRVTASDISKYLALGSPEITIGVLHDTSISLVEVELPNPALYGNGTRVTIISGGTHKFNFNVRYTTHDDTYLSETAELTDKMLSDGEQIYQVWETDGSRWYQHVAGC